MRPYLAPLPLLIVLLGCDPAEKTCADPLEFTTGSLEGSGAVDGTVPQQPAVFDASISLYFDCEQHEDSFVVKGGALVDTDQKTKLFDLDGEFAQSPATVGAAACSEGSSGSRKVGLEISGPSNEELFGHCGKKLWMEVTVVREGCAETGGAAEQLFASQVFITCP